MDPLSASRRFLNFWVWQLSKLQLGYFSRILCGWSRFILPKRFDRLMSRINNLPWDVTALKWTVSNERIARFQRNDSFHGNALIFWFAEFRMRKCNCSFLLEFARRFDTELGYSDAWKILKISKRTYEYSIFWYFRACVIKWKKHRKCILIFWIFNKNLSTKR